MSGWKTWTAGLASIVTGVGVIGAELAKDVPPDSAVLVTGVEAVIAGLAILGIGHKIEKTSV